MLRPLLQLKTSLNIMKTHTSYEERTLFINNYLVFSKNYIMPPYKKLQTLISAFIKNLIFGKNRDPCCQKDHFGGAGHSKSCATQETFCDGSLDQGEVGVGYSSQQLEEEEMGGIPIFR